MKTMNRYLQLTAIGALLAGPIYADADTDDTGPDTMEVVEEGTTPEDIVGVIELPADASDTARERAAGGLETANAAREDGRAFGLEMAESRSEAGRQIGDAARESAADVANEARERASDAAEQARENAADVAEDARRDRGGRP